MPRKVRRLRAILAGLVMLVVAGLLVTYVVTGVRNKRIADAAASSTSSPTAHAPRASTPRTSPPRASTSKPTPKASPSPAPTAAFNARTNSFSFSARLLFDLNSAQLLPDAKNVLDGVVSRVVDEQRYGTIAVRGYTDNTGSDAINQSLSQRRADAVADYLAERLDKTYFTLTAIGEGATNFVADNTTDAGRP